MATVFNDDGDIAMDGTYLEVLDAGKTVTSSQSSVTTTPSFTVVRLRNDDDTDTLTVSFDGGTTDHDKLVAGDQETYIQDESITTVHLKATAGTLYRAMGR